MFHSYANPGNYTATVWVNDSQGYHALAVAEISVYAESTASAYASPNPTDVGIGASFYPGILDGVPPQYSFNWSFGDGESSSYVCSNPCGPNPAGTFHAYTAAGLYTVRVSITYSNSAIVNESFQILVNSNPAIRVLSATPNPANLDSPVTLNTTVLGGTLPYSYSWSFGDGGTAGNLSEITHLYTTNGPFVASVRVADKAGFTMASSINITITLQATITANESLGAAPLSAFFTSEIEGGVPGYTYLWQFGDGTTSLSPDPDHTYLRQGEYSARLEVKDTAGNTAEALWNLEVFPGGGNLEIRVAATSTSLSVGETTSLTLVPSGGTGKYTLKWIAIPVGCSTISSLSLNCTPVVNGTYTAMAQVTDGSGMTATGQVAYTVGGASIGGPGGGGFLGLAGGAGPYLVGGLGVGALIGVIVGAILVRRFPAEWGADGTKLDGRVVYDGEQLDESQESEARGDHLRDLF